MYRVHNDTCVGRRHVTIFSESKLHAHNTHTLHAHIFDHVSAADTRSERVGCATLNASISTRNYSLSHPQKRHWTGVRTDVVRFVCQSRRSSLFYFLLVFALSLSIPFSDFHFDAAADELLLLFLFYVFQFDAEIPRTKMNCWVNRIDGGVRPFLELKMNLRER